MVMWPAQLDTEHCYLPTMVVPIYLIAFLHAFELLGWQELGQGQLTLSRGFDLMTLQHFSKGGGNFMNKMPNRHYSFQV